MKKFLYAVMAVTAAVLFASCGSKTGTPAATSAATTAPEAPSIVAATTGGASDKVPDPTTPVVAVVAIYADNNSKTGLVQEMDSIDSLDATLLMKKLVEYKMVGTDTTVMDFQNNGGNAVLNLTALADTSHKTLVAIANTYIESFELNTLTIQVKGTAVKGASKMEYEPNYKTLK